MVVLFCPMRIMHRGTALGVLRMGGIQPDWKKYPRDSGEE